MVERQRIVIFVGRVDGVPGILLRAALAALRGRDDVELVAVCIPKLPKTRRRRFRYLAARLRWILRRLVGRAPDAALGPLAPIDLPRLARRHGFEVIELPGRDVNQPALVERVRQELRPSLSFSFYVIQRFRPALLAACGRVVNYHNGYLPHYAGLKATGWSLYRGEKESGFAFHYMDEAIDRGPLLLRAALPVEPGESAARLDRRKAQEAARRLPEILQRALDGDPGEPQEEGGSYFDRAACRAIARVDDPSALSAAELERRLRAFGSLELTLGGRRFRVDALRRVPRPGAAGRLPVFASADGAVFAIARGGRRST